MKVQQFAAYISVTTDCPEGYDPDRWNAMLLWWKTREKLKEPPIYGFMIVLPGPQTVISTT